MEAILQQDLQQFSEGEVEVKDSRGKYARYKLKGAPRVRVEKGKTEVVLEYKEVVYSNDGDNWYGVKHGEAEVALSSDEYEMEKPNGTFYLQWWRSDGGVAVFYPKTYSGNRFKP